MGFIIFPVQTIFPVGEQESVPMANASLKNVQQVFIFTKILSITVQMHPIVLLIPSTTADNKIMPAKPTSRGGTMEHVSKENAAPPNALQGCMLKMDPA